MEQPIRQSVLEILREFSTPERPIYLVGGAVRDMLLSRPVHDLDFVLAGPTRKLANDLASRFNGALYMLDEERDTCRVVLETGDQTRFMVDFAALRGPDIEADLRARDFTINAIAMDVAHQDKLIDPLGGAADLHEKRLRACTPDSLRSDPARVLRAARIALRLRMRILPDTLRQMREAAPLLRQISSERQRDELFNMLDGPRVDLALRVLDQVDALKQVLPELHALKGLQQPAPHTLDGWEHTLSVLNHLELLLAPLVGQYQEDQVSDLTVGSAVLWLGRFRAQLAEHFSRPVSGDRSLRSLLFFAALYHDISKPDTRTVTDAGRIRFLGHDQQGAQMTVERGRTLALSTAELQHLHAIVKNHMRVHQLSGALKPEPEQAGVERISRRSIYRYFKDTGAAGIDIALLSLADTRGTYGVALPQDVWQAELETCRVLFEAYWEKKAETVSPPRHLSGGDLMAALELPPGPLIGQILDAVREAQAVGEINDRDAALAFARRHLATIEKKEELPCEERDE